MLGISHLHPFWQQFVNVIGLLNIILPLFFLREKTAVFILIGCLTGMAVMAYLTSKFGFVRLLGIGHVVWLPGVIYMWSQVGQVHPTSFYGVWFWATLLVDTFALTMDAWDVSRYICGERDEMVEGLDALLQGG